MESSKAIPSKPITDLPLKVQVNSSPSVTFLCLHPGLFISNLSSLSDDSVIIVGGGQCEQFPVFFQWVEYL